MFGWKVPWAIRGSGLVGLIVWYVLPTAGVLSASAGIPIALVFLVPFLNFYRHQKSRIATGTFPVQFGIPSESIPLDGESLNMQSSTSRAMYVAIAGIVLAMSAIDLVTSTIDSVALKFLVALPVVYLSISLMFCRAILMNDGIAYRALGNFFGSWFVPYSAIRRVELVPADDEFSLSTSQRIWLRLKSGDVVQLPAVQVNQSNSMGRDWVMMINSKLSGENK